MKQRTGRYQATLMTYNKSQLQAYALFKRFFRENYPFGFTYQITSKDFIN
ncbi:hypothetical protein [Pedobacter gandavensis]|nr:hypothetical protein [Pedobacter gandavensis]